jgi:hypothetical protein
MDLVFWIQLSYKISRNKNSINNSKKSVKIMIHQIDTTDNIVAFRALAEVTKEDFLTVVVPAVEHLVKQTNEINFLLVLDTDIKNFTAGAWLEDALLGLKHLGKWNRAAIITDTEEIISFTNGFSYIVPGEFKGFKKVDFNKALNWVEGNIEVK